MSKYPETTALASGRLTGEKSAGVATDESYNELAFWESLIDEAAGAEFADVTVRCMQGLRYRGGGPKYVRLSSRCIRYRRRDIREWAEARLRSSTSDQGTKAA